MSSAKDETVSYTSVITASTYETMQAAQDLHVPYENFAEELKSLLSKCKGTDVTIKFIDRGADLQLGFYTMTSIKEITLLCVSFTRTPADTLVQYFKRKAEFYASRCAALDSQLKTTCLDQRSAIDERERQMASLQECFKNEKQCLKNTLDSYKQEVSRRIKSANMEVEQLRDKVRTLHEERRDCSVEMARQEGVIAQLQQNVTELKGALKLNAIENQQQLVALQKYDKMKKLFSSTLADLLKYQVILKKVQSLTELQKAENGRLHEDVRSCVDYIAAVCHDDNVLAQVVQDNKNVSETMGALDDRIARLQLSARTIHKQWDNE